MQILLSVALHGDRDPRIIGVFRFADGQGVDVEAAAHDEPGNAGQNAVFVFYVNCNHIAHGESSVSLRFCCGRQHWCAQ